VVKKQTRDIL